MAKEIETTEIFEFMHNEYVGSNKKILFALEGSSGSGKTWSIIDFVIDYCRIHAYENKLLTIGRESYKDCFDTVIHDFIKRLKMIGGYEEDKHFQSHPQKYFLLGNEINFTGWSTNGQPSKRQDLLWFNEIFESNEEIFKQYNQRTNDVVISDYNPKVTEHWVYDKILNRADCKWRHCKMIDNPFLPSGQKEELLAYEPWMPGSYEVDIARQLILYKGNPICAGNYPPAHPDNVRNGTADTYMWMVYGLGLRMAQTGLIFQNVNYIDEWPEGVNAIHGLDFGFTTDPSALVRVGETSRDLFLELLMYESTDAPELIDEYCWNKNINKRIVCFADSSDKYTKENSGTIEMVKGLKKLGWNIRKVRKTKSIMYWLGQMKQKRINIINNELVHHFRKEQQNYKMKEINGIAINQPIDKYNHAWDGSRYGYMGLNGSGSYLF